MWAAALPLGEHPDMGVPPAWVAGQGLSPIRQLRDPGDITAPPSSRDVELNSV